MRVSHFAATGQAPGTPFPPSLPVPGSPSPRGAGWAPGAHPACTELNVLCTPLAPLEPSDGPKTLDVGATDGFQSQMLVFLAHPTRKI